VHFISPRNISFCTRSARANSMYKFKETSVGRYTFINTYTYTCSCFPSSLRGVSQVMDEGKQKGRYV